MLIAVLANTCFAADEQTTDKKSASGGVTIRLRLNPATSDSVKSPSVPAKSAEKTADEVAKKIEEPTKTLTNVQFEDKLELSPSAKPATASQQSSDLPLLELAAPAKDSLDKKTPVGVKSTSPGPIVEPIADGQAPKPRRTTEPDALPQQSHVLPLSTVASHRPNDLSLDSSRLQAPSAGNELRLEEAPTSGEVETSLKFSDNLQAASRQSNDASNECPGSPDGKEPELSSEPDDIPLEQEEHPYDAPAAESTAPPASKANVSSDGLSLREQKIQAGIQECLQYFLEHPENTTRRGPWALMHATLPFGVESTVIAGGRSVNTIGWMSFNGVCAKQRVFQPTRQGFRTNVGPGVQGHEGQFLAILAQSNVSAEYPLQIGNRRYTVMDLARYEMATCVEKSELTFKLIGLSHYLPPNQTWRDNRGHVWTLEKMVAEELAQPVNGAACGGTHRLMGLSYAIIERQAAGQPINGHWSRAERYLNDYINYTMSLQNPDGSFSTNWFESRGLDADVERKVQTTGHILEWLVYTLPDDHLRSPRIQLGIEFLLNTVGREPQKDWPIGPRGHALRTLTVYSQRVFGAEPGKMKSYVAQSTSSPTLR